MSWVAAMISPPVRTLMRLMKVAKQHLRYVYGGNFNAF